MATLTGQRIKDTYDAVLKLEDNAALTSSPKAITDGLGNNTPISVSTIKVDVSSDLEAASFVKTSGLSTQFLKADGSVDSSAYLTSGDLPASHWSSNLVGIDYAGGNVGIGTTSPTKLLEVKSSSAYDSTVRLSTIAHNWDIQGGESGYSSTSFALDYDGTTFFRAMGATDARFSGGLSVGTINPTPPTGGLYVAGNVGIGTTSPSQKLDVNGNIKLNQYGQSIYFGSTVNEIKGSTSDFLYKSFSRVQWDNAGTYADSSYVFKQSGSEVFRIHTGGNVGIGTTSPSAKLTVNAGDINISTSLPTIGSLYNKLNFWSTTAGQGVGASIGAYRGNNYVSGGLIFETGELTTSEKMRITPSGNVGIGTDSPSEKLEVAGDMNLYNPSATSQINFRNIGGANYIKSNGYSTHFGLRGNTGNGVFIIEDSFATTQDIRIKPTTSGWDFSSRGVAGANALLTIDSVLNISNKTNVGIGTTSPSAKLHIEASDPRIKIVDSDGTNWQSEVFTQGGALKLQARNGTNFGNISFQGDNGTTQSEYARFNSVGNLGIGTTSPSSKLHVAGATVIDGFTTGSAMALNVGGSNNAQIRTRHIEGKSYNSSSLGELNLNYYSSHNVSMAVGGGNVGIGTTTPSYPFVVKRTGSNVVASFEGNENTYLRIARTGTQSGEAQLRVTNNGSFSITSDSNISLKTGGVSGTTRLYVRNNDGNVGIGTTSPAEKLHVFGGAAAIEIDSTTNEASLKYDNSTTTAAIKLANNDLKTELGGSEVMRILSNGNVGIGTNSPSQKLEVDGQVLSEGYRLAAMQTAPATRNSTGTLGEIVIDGNYIYVCYAANSWSRVALETSW